jgi:hypothetical protein
MEGTSGTMEGFLLDLLSCCLDGEDHEAHTTGMGRGLGQRPSSAAAATGGCVVGIDVEAGAAATGRGAIGGGGGQPIGEKEARGLGLRARVSSSSVLFHR